MTRKLNEFQLSTQEIIKKILDDAGVPASFEIFGGPDEFAAMASFGQFVTRIYPDGAGIGGPNIDMRYEIYDYGSLDDLRQAYVSDLRDLIRSKKL